MNRGGAAGGGRKKPVRTGSLNVELSNHRAFCTSGYGAIGRGALELANGISGVAIIVSPSEKRPGDYQPLVHETAPFQTLARLALDCPVTQVCKPGQIANGKEELFDMFWRSNISRTAIWVALAASCPSTAQTTFTNGALVWKNDTNVSLYVVLESPDITLPRRLWNVIGTVTNIPPSPNAQIVFPVSLTNRYPDVSGANADYFTLMEWTNSLPSVQPWTNWAVVEEVCTPTVDAAGRVTGYSTRGQWFVPTNDISTSLMPYSEMPGVTNNNPDFNLIHF